MKCDAIFFYRMEFLSTSVEETNAYARRFLDQIRSRTSGVLVVGLYGELGAGKTTFVQAVARALGVQEEVQSPTFVLLKQYRTKDPVFKTLIHIDAYRLKNASELGALRFSDFLDTPGTLILIEWPERIADAVPVDHIKILFEHVNEAKRKITTNI